MVDNNNFVDKSVSVHVASSNNAVAIAFERSLIVTRTSAMGEDFERHTIVTASQHLRCVDFFGDGTYVATAGDAKMITVYDLADGNVKQAFSYGPHAKRVIQIRGIPGTSSFVFGDKFGEVFMLTVKGTSLEGPEFILQHMSTLSNLLITRPYLSSGRRILTGDKDAHLRVSKFPNAFEIESFLWRPAPQAAISAMDEIACVPASFTGDAAAYNVVAGDVEGNIFVWRTAEGAQSELVDQFNIGNGAIVSMAAVSSVDAKTGSLVLAVEGSKGLISIPYTTDSATCRVTFTAPVEVDISDESGVAAMIAFKRDLVLLLRSGAIFKLSGTTATPLSYKPLQAVTAGFSNSFADADLLALWRVNEKPQRQNKDEDGEGSEEELDKKIAKKESQ